MRCPDEGWRALRFNVLSPYPGARTTDERTGGVALLVGLLSVTGHTKRLEDLLGTLARTTQRCYVIPFEVTSEGLATALA